MPYHLFEERGNIFIMIALYNKPNVTHFSSDNFTMSLFFYFQVTKDLPVPQAFDQLLDIVEESFHFQNNSKWLSTSYELDRFSGNSLKLLNAACTRFDEYISQHSQISTRDERFEIHTLHTSMINDIYSRFKILCKLLSKEHDD